MILGGVGDDIITDSVGYHLPDIRLLDIISGSI